MATDIDRPSTWIKYREGLCHGCNSGCCQMPVEVHFDDLIRLQVVSEDDRGLSRRKLANRLIKEKVIQSYRHGTDLFMLGQGSNRDCVFLDFASRRCRVYENRPSVCRQFPTVGPRPTFCPHKKV